VLENRSRVHLQCNKKLNDLRAYEHTVGTATNTSPVIIKHVSNPLILKTTAQDKNNSFYANRTKWYKRPHTSKPLTENLPSELPYITRV